MAGVKCFLLSPSDQVKRHLRRYRSGDLTCRGPMSYHDARIELDIVPAIWEEYGDGETRRVLVNNCDDTQIEIPHDDPRWPKHCACGYAFSGNDEWQIFVKLLYRRSDNGALTTIHDAGPGAMWWADWMPSNMYWDNPRDNENLIVICPGGGEWNIDSRASNCTLPNDRTHRCWIRSGQPPLITASKQGLTCSAGSGSIQTHNWHGFLRNGELVVS